MPQIVIPDDEPAIMLPSMAYGKLAGRDVRAYADRPSGPDDLAARVGDAEIVINIRSTSRFTATVLEKCPQLRLISIWGTGNRQRRSGCGRSTGNWCPETDRRVG